MRALFNSILLNKWTKVVVFLLCLIPVYILLWRVYQQDLTANPISFVEHWFGDWTMRFLLITLSITPLRKLLRLPLLIRFRRMLGLFAFFYVGMHFCSWLILDHFFNFPEMWADVLKRRYITVGFAGFVLLIPLAITSTAGWIRRLGGKRWQLLHRAIYIAAICGVIHYYWLVKSDESKPLQYAAILAVLLVWRFGIWLYGRTRRAAMRPPVSPKPTTAESA